MARPQPIVVNTPMGTQTVSKRTSFLEALQGLNQLASLYQGTIGVSKQKEAEAEGYKSLARTLGMDRTSANQSPIVETSTNPVRVLGDSASMNADGGEVSRPASEEPSFLVNLPQPQPAAGFDALANSKLGQDLIKKQYEQSIKPEELGAVETPRGVVTYGKTGRSPAKLAFAAEKEPTSDHYTIREKANPNNIQSIRLKSGEAIPEGFEPVPTSQGSVRNQIVPDKSSPTGLRYFNEETPGSGKYTIPGQPAPKSSMDQDQRDMLRFDNLVSSARQDPTVSQYIKIQGLSPRLERAYSDYKKAGNPAVLDDAILYAINKMNDPDSVVMIGEYMRTKELQSIYHSAQGNLLKMFQDTAGLAPEFREQFLDAIRKAVKDKEALYDQRIDYYRDRGSEYNSNKRQIEGAFPKSSDKATTIKQKEAGAEQIAPTGTKAKLPNGKIVTSDGKGGWN